MIREPQLNDLQDEYEAFVHTVSALSPQAFLASLGSWTPRDIVAHLIGWNRGIQMACGEILEGREPFYFYDGDNDYRTINAGFIAQYSSRDRDALLSEMERTKETLVSYLKGIDEADWDRDTGVEHYRGGPATPARCVDSLIRDYRNHRDEILQAS